MRRTLHLEIELPGNLAQFQLPTGVSDRLAALLDKQDAGQSLTGQEKREAEGLVELADTLRYLGLRVRAA